MKCIILKLGKTRTALFVGISGRKSDVGTGKATGPKAKVLTAFEMLGDADVPDDGERYAVVGWKQWSDLLGIEEFAHADYIGDGDLPWKGTQAKRWLGTLWMPHSGLTKTSSVRYCYWYHKTAIGHAVGSDVKTDITWHGDRAANFINNRAHARLGSRVHYICMCDPGSFLRLGYSAAWRAPDKRSIISCAAVGICVPGP